METFIIAIAVAIVAAAAGAFATLLVQKRMAGSRARLIISEAEKEAENLRNNKVLQGREEALRITAEAEKQAQQRQSRQSEGEKTFRQGSSPQSVKSDDSMPKAPAKYLTAFSPV